MMTKQSIDGRRESDLDKDNASLDRLEEATTSGERNVRLADEKFNDPYLVQLLPDDPENPRSWSTPKKLWIVTLVSVLNVIAASIASAYATGINGITKEFGISEEVATIAESGYILMFGCGPLIVAPLSELVGRRPVYLVAWALFTILMFAVAFTPTYPGLVITRFLTGLAASPPLSNTGGTISDVAARDSNGHYMAIYILGSCIGPAFGNVWAGHLAQAYGWRRVFQAAIGILGGFWLIILFFLPETRHSKILRSKVDRKRKETGEPWHANSHISDDELPVNNVTTPYKKLGRNDWYIAMTRPFRFMLSEPAVQFCALWNAFLFMCIFLANDALPNVFGDKNGGYAWSVSGNIQLTFLSIIVGSLVGALSFPFTQEPYYQHVLRNKGTAIPEARLFMGTITSVTLPIGLFILAWTCFPNQVPFIVPLIGLAIFSFGFYHVLYGILALIIDSYGQYTASALAGIMLMRNIAGAAAPLFANYMYQRLENHWATSLIAFLSIPLIPVTVWFFFKGERVRRASPFAATHLDDGDVPH